MNHKTLAPDILHLLRLSLLHNCWPSIPALLTRTTTVASTSAV